jgi:hypothetical protein
MHGAPYVNPRVAKTLGRLGRSHGCPAVRPDVAQLLIDTLKEGQYVFSYYPDPKWLASSPLLNCNKPAKPVIDTDLMVFGRSAAGSP